MNAHFSGGDAWQALANAAAQRRLASIKSKFPKGEQLAQHDFVRAKQGLRAWEVWRTDPLAGPEVIPGKHQPSAPPTVDYLRKLHAVAIMNAPNWLQRWRARRCLARFERWLSDRVGPCPLP